MSNIIQRPRRLRYHSGLRDMLTEVRLNISDLIYPVFIKEGISQKKEIDSMPGVFQYSIDEVVKEVKEAWDLGIKAVILFGIPKHKDERASGAYDQNGIVQLATRKIKEACPKILIITDVCLCEYMSHGHCGLISENGEIENDSSLEILANTALSHVQAGADMVAPSDMMDGRVLAIRTILDQNNFQHIPIMSYAVKYASSFYGPFRDAAESAPSFGDRKSYQMGFTSEKEAIREAMLDEEEGADFIMVKPAMAYLDIIRVLKDTTNLPLVAYQVSGEYSMLMAAHQKGFLSLEDILLESLVGMKRAGAQLIITYFAKQIAGFLET